MLPFSIRRSVLSLGLTFILGRAAAQCPLEKVHVDPAPALRQGHAVATDGARLLTTSTLAISELGSPQAAYGAAWIHRREGDTWVLEQKLDAAGDGQVIFGWDGDIDGSTAVVSAPVDCVEDCLPFHDPGFVDVFELGPDGWQRVLRASASDAVPGVTDAFGAAVAVDGERAVVGAPIAGKAYVFERLDGVWQETAILQGAPDGFGRTVALDGDTIAVGAPVTFLTALGPPGAVSVFDRQGDGEWLQVAVLHSPFDHSGFENFGDALALSGDTLAIGSSRASFGAPWEPVTQAVGASACGAVLVHERGDGSWPLVARLTSPSPAGSEFFGRSLALEGDLLLAGASAGQVGGTHLLRRTTLGWSAVASAGPPLPETDGPKNEFGWSVALGGGVLAIGAPGEDAGGFEDAGAVFTAHADTFGCAGQDLLGSPALVRLAEGGAHVLGLAAGPAHAGRAYVLLGSVTGTSPGFFVGPVHVPLVPDAYTWITLANAGAGPFVATLGLLDEQGGATAALALPPGLDAILVGVTLHHAFVTFDAQGVVAGASSPQRLSLLP